MYTRIAWRDLKVSFSDVGEGRVAVNCEKNTIIPEHSVPKQYIAGLAREDNAIDRIPFLLKLVNVVICFN